MPTKDLKMIVKINDTIAELQLAK